MSLTACYPGSPVVSAPTAFDAGDVDYIADAILGSDDPRGKLDFFRHDARRADLKAFAAEYVDNETVVPAYHRDYARMVRLACRVAAWHLSPRQAATPQDHKAQVRKADARSIKENTDLVAYIDQHIRLVKAGAVFKAPCPFHDDRTPSFCVWPDGHWKCFGCQEGGDIFSFVMLWHKVDFKGALEILTGGS